jgi:hypothetical protein
MNRRCPNLEKKKEPEPLRKNNSLNLKTSIVTSKKLTVSASNKAIQPIKKANVSRPLAEQHEIVKSDIDSKQQISHVSFDSFTQASGSDFQTYCPSSEMTIQSVHTHEKTSSLDHQIHDEPEKKEHSSVKNEVIDIANMLESLQLQTPAKPLKKEVNFKTAGDGVCIGTDGPCLTVLTPVRASRKAEKDLGVKNVITPVRRSIRNATVISGDESTKKQEQIHNLLNDHDFAYVPNNVF